MTITEAPAAEAAESAEDAHRAAIVQGFLEAAEFIRTHPDLPLPPSVSIHRCIFADTDKAGDDEAYRIAGILGAQVTGEGGIATTALAFGPVRYEAAYRNSDRQAAYEAHMEPYFAAQRPARQRVAEIRADLAADRTARQERGAA